MERASPKQTDTVLALNSIAQRRPVTFFDLSAELRLVIYEEVLIHKSILEIYPYGEPVEHIDEWERTHQSWAKFRPSEPSLTRTCRQLRQETLPIFYGKNTFGDSEYDPCCATFLRWLTPEKRMMLRTVRVGLGIVGHELVVHGSVHRVDRKCVNETRYMLEDLHKSIHSKGMEVPPDIFYVEIRPTFYSGLIWTNKIERECGLSGVVEVNESVTVSLVGSLNERTW